ncbi:TetR family transcriptional regulator [Cryptosporangium sp. NPDC051539]|uniref:TetR/AcrR family transcriptional regulator n=1 Tax=Cryptosporangium sp. NPDC051539 TaxID=3363962 RepID=UPI0037B260C5
MRTRNAPETRRRILAAATGDFAERGIAGARVDRIAAGAGVNKAQIYAYFGDKQALFEAVYRKHAAAIVDETPFSVDDLPGYAVGLYEAAQRRPDVIRLLAWARLEGVDLPMDEHAVREKVDEIARAQSDGRLDATASPQDVLALVTSMALTWSVVGLSPVTGSDHEAALRHTVALAFAGRRSS